MHHFDTCTNVQGKFKFFLNGKKNLKAIVLAIAIIPSSATLLVN